MCVSQQLAATVLLVYLKNSELLATVVKNANTKLYLEMNVQSQINLVYCIAD